MENPISSLLTKYSKIKHAESYKPCNPGLIAEYAGLLTNSGHAWSDELSSFYKISNGFYYNGIYIFSIKSEEVDEGYDLAVQNVKWNIAERLPGCLLFGRSDEEVYVFNQPENKYQILDFTAWDEYYAFDSLAELFEFVITERI